MSWLLLGVLATIGLANANVPDYLEPISYDLSFIVNLDNPGDEFQGTNIVQFKTLKNLPFNVSEIVLNSLDLSIDSAIFRYPSKKEKTINHITTNVADETISLKLDEAIAPNNLYELAIKFRGSLNGTEGLFISKVNNENYLGMKSYPVYAKRIYPCFDKPNLRAKYQVRLEISYSRKKTPVVVTGLNLVSQQSTSKKLQENYASTVNLPPYGFYFTVGNYYKPSNDLPVYLPNDESFTSNINQDLWDAISAPVVKSMSSSSQVGITMVTVPGLNVPSVPGYGIAAISRDITVDMPGSSVDTLKDQALQLLRAPIHSFLTTVVSPSSWEHMWLAESIPTFIAHAAFNEMTSNWKDWPKTEVLDLQQSALADSWTSSSSPVIASNLNTSSSVVKFLSDPAIVKGSAFLGMLETFAANPLASFAGYVREKQGKSVNSEEFLNFYAYWNNLNSTLPDGKTLWTIFKPWLVNSGYPYISIYRNDHEVLVNKRQFGQEANGGWMLPLSYQTYFVNNSIILLGADKNFVWLDDKVNGNYSIVKDDTRSLVVVFNVQGPGPYRVLYDDRSLKLLSKELENNVNYLKEDYLRSTLISDNFAFANRGLLSYVSLFDTLRYLGSERSLSPWNIASTGLRQFWNIIYFSDLRLQFQNYVTDLMRPSYFAYGLRINDGNFVTGKLVKLIVSSMCDYGDEVCRRETKDAYNKYIVGKVSIANTGIVDELYCSGLRDVTDGEHIAELLASSYSTSLTTYQKQSLFYYLACSGGEDGMSPAIYTLLESVLISDKYQNMPAEDMILAFKEVANKPQRYEVALGYFVDNYYQIRHTINEEKKAELIRYLGSLGSTDDHVYVFGNFTFRNVSSKDTLQAVQDAIKSVQTNKQFLLNHYQDIYNGLYGFNPSSTTENPNTSAKPTNTPPEPSPTTPTGAAPQSAVVPIALLLMSALVLRYLN